MRGESHGGSSRRTVGIAALTIAFALLSLVPYGVSALRTPPRSRFTGLMTLPADQMWDLAAQRDVAHGLGQANRYTTERHAPALVSPLYPALGAVQRFSHLPQNLVYHLPRLIIVLALPVITLWFFGLCFPEQERIGWLATVLALITVGAGASLADPTLARSSDFAVPESNTLVSATTSPHFAVAQVGLLVLFASLLLVLRGRSTRFAVLVAIAGTLLVCISHPFLVLPFFLTLGIAALALLATRYRRERDARVSSLVVVLLASAFTSLPFLVVVGRTSRHYTRVQGHGFPATPADAWWTWVLGFGVVVPLAVVALVRFVVRREIALGPLALIAWLACQAPLIYLAVLPFQRRFGEGLMFPLAGLAALGLAGARRASHNDERANLGVVAVVGIVLGLAVIGAARLSSLGLSMNTETAAALRAVHRGDVVLAGDQIAAVLPGLSDGVVYLGRRVETVAWSRKAAEREEFVVHPATSWDWLRRNGITTLIVDRRDATFLPRETELESKCFRPFVHYSSLSVYRVLAICATSR
jgi:hypothetical protein